MNIQVVAVTDDSISLKWQAPEQSGGSRVKGNVVEAQEKGTERREYSVMCKTKHCKGQVVGLNHGSDYYFRVRALNDCGFSDPRDLVSSAMLVFTNLSLKTSLELVRLSFSFSSLLHQLNQQILTSLMLKLRPAFLPGSCLTMMVELLLATTLLSVEKFTDLFEDLFLALKLETRSRSAT